MTARALSNLMLSLPFVVAACASAPAHRRSTADPVATTEPQSGVPAPELIEIRVLFIGTSSRSAADALERARMIATMAKSGAQLSERVPKYSERPGAAEDFGVFRIKTAQPQPFSAAVAAVAVALPIRGVSDAVPVDGGYLVVERMKDPPVGPAHIAAKHILIGYVDAPRAIPGATRSEAEARTLAEQIAREAQAPNADWDALAAKYTEEPGGKQRAGDLGEFGRGQMVPVFEQAAFALAVGQTSQVIQSPFGFHVIKRYK